MTGERKLLLLEDTFKFAVCSWGAGVRVEYVLNFDAIYIQSTPTVYNEMKINNTGYL